MQEERSMEQSSSLDTWIDLIFDAEMMSYWIEGQPYPHPFTDCVGPIIDN